MSLYDKKSLTLKKLILFFCIIWVSAQSETNYKKWQDYFSYNNVFDIIEQGDRFLCITQNGLFTYDHLTQEIEKTSKVNGLHGVNITAADYNEDLDYLIVAYKSGAFDVITPDGIEYFVDVPIDTDYQGRKAINHIHTVGDRAVFSMDFGLAIFNLVDLEFESTTYFRENSIYYKVYESLLFNDKVIALCENGIYTHALDAAIPNFFGWQSYYEGTTFRNAEIYQDKAILASAGTLLSSTDGAAFQNLSNLGYIIDIKAGSSCLSVMHPNRISTYNTNLIFQGDSAFPDYSIRTGICSSQGLFAGTDFSGLVSYDTDEQIAPDGPYSNSSYKLTLFEDQIYVAPGGRNNSNFYSPSNNKNGYYHYKEGGWIHASVESIQQENICELAINPLNTEEVYAASFSSNGLAVTTNDVLSSTITADNSSFIGIQDLNTGIFKIRSISNIFDEEGNYYAVEAYSINNDGNSLNFRSPNGQWKNVPLTNNGASTSHLLLDSKGWIWVGTTRVDDGVFVYNTNGTLINTNDDTVYTIRAGEGNGNLPSDQKIICLAEDKNGTIWIGTTQGIRYKRNAISALEEGNPETNLVVIEQDGIPEEFLKDVLVLDIAVDEANNKWISTGGGVFYVSSDATETKKIFTEDNSPLPSNFITDIEIDPITGKVYFASSDGLVSYQGDYTEVGDEFGEIIVYPNPARPDFQGNIVIKGLANNAKVKITDVNGNLVYEGVARGGALEWDQRNLRGKKVASGVYLALMLNRNNLITATTKFVIVR